MARKKTSDSPGETVSPQRARFLRSVGLNALAGYLFFGGLGTGLYYAREYVDREATMPDEPPTIVLKNKPHWMSGFLVERIAATARPVGLHSAFDHDMLVDTRKALEANPWISKVYDVRRAYRNKPGDTLIIDCEYRVPAALVRWGAYFWLVDRNGYKLPEQYEPADVAKILQLEDGHIDIRLVEGIVDPPPETGRKWSGRDLAAGVEMALLLADKPYAQDIVKINVSRFFSHSEPHVVLVTKYDTEIRWGRTPSETLKEPFIEVSTATKLDYLRKIFTQYGRTDAGQAAGIDIRFDKVTYPAPDTASSRTDAGQ